jgi:hypothetical protein
MAFKKINWNICIFFPRLAHMIVTTVKKSGVHLNTGTLLAKCLAMGFYRTTLPHLIVNNLLFIYLTKRYILIILHSKELIIFRIDLKIFAFTFYIKKKR